MNTALEYSTRVVQEGGRRCKKSTLNDLVHMTPLRIPLMNPPNQFVHLHQRRAHHCFIYTILVTFDRTHHKRTLVLWMDRHHFAALDFKFE
jgi:hypothetical protein